MIWKLSNSIACFLVPDCEEEDKEIYSYGVWVLLSTIFTSLEVLLLGLVLHSVVESIIYLLILMILRSYTGGYHATTSAKCNMLSIGCFVGSVVLSKGLVMLDSKVVLGIILLAVEIIIFLKAPVEHENKPLSEKEKVQYRRYSIFLSLGICIAVVLLYDRYVQEVTFTVVMMLLVGFMMVLELVLQRKDERIEL